MPANILLVEDTTSLAMVYNTVLKREGYTAVLAADFASSEELISNQVFDVVLLDLQLPDGDGMDLMPKILRSNPDARIIVITANGSINRAVEAMKRGSFDFLVKPFDERRLLSAVGNAIAGLNEQKKSAPPTAHHNTKDKVFHGLIGSSERMQTIYQMVRNIGKSTATVFVTGESGTGKELCAHAIHAESRRANGPFLPLNCGAIPRDLLESEVFGHLKGSFTGAISDKQGAAAAADGGTLFLDEICEMDLALQTKLLRFLQTSTIQPVGSVKPRTVDVRIVCATNRDPLEEVRAGRFREDLYYRLHVVPIHMPALRDRREDIMEIAEHALRSFSTEEGKDFVGFSDAAREKLVSMDFPGNVRQLLNILRNIVVLNEGPIVSAPMIPIEAVGANRSRTPLKAVEADVQVAPPVESKPAIPGTGPLSRYIGTALADLEREFIELTIEFCGGSIPQAARLLDVSPSTIYRKKESWDKSA